VVKDLPRVKTSAEVFRTAEINDKISSALWQKLLLPGFSHLCELDLPAVSFDVAEFHGSFLKVNLNFS